MPRQSKAIGPNALVGETTATPPVQAQAAKPETKSGAVRQALDAYPDLMPKQIAQMLKAEGWDVNAQLVSVVKSKLKVKSQEQGQPQKSVRPTAKKQTSPPRSAPAATAPAAAAPATTPAGKTPGISFDSLKKAKELAAQLGGVSQAQEALAALSDLLD